VYWCIYGTKPPITTTIKHATVAALISILLQRPISLQVLSFTAVPCCMLQLVLFIIESRTQGTNKRT